MTRRNVGKVLLANGGLLLVCLTAVVLSPRVSASPVRQATPSSVGVTPPPPAGRTPAPSDSQPTQPADQQQYVVQSGDTLWSIAANFYGNGSKYTLIQSANGLSDGERLRVGMTLTIPSETQAPPSAPGSSLSPTPTAVPLLTLVAEPTQIVPAESPSPLPQSTLQAVALTDKPGGSGNSGIAPLIPYLTLLINGLSGICFLGSLTCAFLSIDAYRRSKRFAERDYIRRRIRVKV
ncbi:MAG: LysM peptidoglycan-binding domain-containing protein [Chloroflexi bacterium]|nr:LysM peptidoglycan-binding domain-containing protein [Chloroflexota bacterium]